MVTVQVYVGVGGWLAQAEAKLVAAPHTGDWIVVGERMVFCERVLIREHDITVTETRRFTSQEEADTYFEVGDL